MGHVVGAGEVFWLGGSREVGLRPRLVGSVVTRASRPWLRSPNSSATWWLGFVSREKMAGPRRTAEDDARLKGAQNL